MRIDEAITRLTPFFEGEKIETDMQDLDAFRLGIEALKAVQGARANNYWTPIPTLPGETEE